MPYSRPSFLLLVCLVVAGCAGRGGVANQGDVPPDAITVASVRPAASPQAHEWIARADLPAGAIRGESGRALLLEVAREDGGAITSFETAPLELANLIVRVTREAARATSVSIESSLSAPLKLDLFVSPDGERFHYASSCPVVADGSAFQQFAEPVTWVAVARVRAADAGELRCK